MPALPYVVAEDLNTGPPICAISALPGDQSPQVQCSSVYITEADLCLLTHLQGCWLLLLARPLP